MNVGYKGISLELILQALFMNLLLFDFPTTSTNFASTPGQCRNSLKKLKKIVVNWSIMLLVTLVLAEIAVRIWEASMGVHNAYKFDVYRPNPNGTGSLRLKPDMDATLNVEGQAITMKTNSMGMAWREVDPKQKNGKQRVAFIGDSFTMGLYAADVEHSFVGITDSMLLPLGYEVLNFGVGGYGWKDMTLILDEEVRKFQPDHVVLSTFIGNDIWDSERGLLPESAIAGDKKSSGSTLYDWSALFRLYSNFRTAMLLQKLKQEDPFIPKIDMASDRLYVEGAHAPMPDSLRGVIRNNLAEIGKMKALCDSMGATFQVISLPFEDQVYSKMERGDDFDVYSPQSYLSEYCAMDSIPYFDVLPALRKHAFDTKERLYYIWDPHFNPAGHRQAGHAMGRWLLNALQK